MTLRCHFSTAFILLHFSDANWVFFSWYKGKKIIKEKLD